MDVAKMQTKLARWSQDQSFNFDDIMNIVYDSDFLHEAWTNVASNSGSETPGVDGATAEDFAENLDGSLTDLRRELKAGSYSPKPVRRTYIPKGDGEKRPLGIPTIKDRVVQESLRLVLEPIYETDFTDQSYGFRPGRSCHDAINVIQHSMAPQLRSYKHWILDLDIAGYFDDVDHTTLLQILQDRITDGDVLQLIWDTLKAGVKENGSVQVTGEGTPQGGVVSPLLANVYLNELDHWIQQWTDMTAAERNWRRRRGKGTWKYVRYADDFLILTSGPKHHAERMMGRVKKYLDEELGLNLSEKKSELTHAQDGLSFLGYDLRACTDTGGCKMYIPKEAKSYIRSQIQKAMGGPTDVSPKLKIRAINRVVRGWAGYYQYCSDASRVFNTIEHRLWHKTTRWLSKKYKCGRSWLIRNRLDSKSPIVIDGETLVQPGKLATSASEMPFRNRHTHPYLGEGGAGTENYWGKRYRKELPPEDPYLASAEKWSEEMARKIRARDENRCMVVGCDAGGPGEENLPVHHIRRRRSKDDDRLENMVTLCRKHHGLTHQGQSLKAYHRGREEIVMLS
jgi:group II intron reverse transcriptase/maturase